MGIDNLAAECDQGDHHYPSWGSITGGLRLDSGQVRSCSLPLMGIDNSVYSLTGFDDIANNSLPLMGIDNLGNRDSIEILKVSLITPHGDR